MCQSMTVIVTPTGIRIRVEIKTEAGMQTASSSDTKYLL